MHNLVSAYREQEPEPAVQTYATLKRKVLEEGRNAIPFVKELLHERDDSLCILGCIAAGKIKDKSFVKPLLVLLTDKNLDVSAYASYALIEIGKENPQIGSQVLKMFHTLLYYVAGDEQLPWWKKRCIYTLCRLNVREAVPDIVAALTDHSDGVRLSAVNALGEMQAKEAAPRIVSLLRSKDEKPSVRFRSAVVLGDLDATDAVDDLVAALKDEAEDVRWGAAMAFKKIKSPKAIPSLIDTITDKSQKVSGEAIRALYFQTGEKVTSDFLRKDSERKDAQDKWRAWWEQNKEKLK